MCNCSSFSTSPALDIIRFYFFYNPCIFVVVFHCNFNLRFPNDNDEFSFKYTPSVVVLIYFSILLKKFSGLWNNTDLLSNNSVCQSLKSVSLKAAPEIKVLVDLCSFWESKRMYFLCLFQLLETACIPWLMTISSIIKAKAHNTIFALWPLLPNLYLLIPIVCFPLRRTIVII